MEVRSGQGRPAGVLGLAPPCIMCVQYRGGAQYHGGVQYHGGYHEYCGDIMSTVGIS